MDKCQLSVRWDQVMIHFKHFLRKQEQENVRYSIELHVDYSFFGLDVPRTVFIDLEPTVIGRKN
jgi:hypothetical protein